jgi:hypothetical protein
MKADIEKPTKQSKASVHPGSMEVANRFKRAG